LIDKAYIVHFCNKRNLHADLYNDPTSVILEFRNLSVAAKMWLYDGTVVPVALYGEEAWDVSKTMVST